MKKKLSNEYLKMSIDPTAPILNTTMLCMPEGVNHLEEFCILHQSKLIDIANKNGGVAYSICDTSSLQPYSFDLLINFYFKFVSKAKAISTSHKVFVLPKLGSFVDVNELLRLSHNSTIYFFDSVDEARKSVYHDWSSRSSQKIIDEVKS